MWAGKLGDQMAEAFDEQLLNVNIMPGLASWIVRTGDHLYVLQWYLLKINSTQKLI